MTSAIARLPSLARRTGEALRDPQPGAGVTTGRDQCRVRAVDALGDQQAEVVRRAGHGLRCVLGPPGPQVARRRGEVDPELLRRGLEPVYREGVAAGADAEVGDVPDAIAHLRLGPEGLVHVERVRPG